MWYSSFEYVEGSCTVLCVLTMEGKKPIEKKALNVEKKDVCALCSKTVYPLEKLLTDGEL